jgi:redox-sensitive bicupin YhaK (pirin superfamily)
VNVLSPLFYVEARLDAGAELALPDEYAERAVYVVAGDVECDGQVAEAGTMAVAEGRGSATVRARHDSRIIVLGGAPVGQRHIWWNFVSSSEARIERAKREWKAGAFPRVPGDETEFIPLP